MRARFTADENSASPISPELKQLHQSAQNSIRGTLRISGLVILTVGLICFVVAFISFFVAFGNFERPRFFWLAVIGLPLIFVGGVLCQFGIMGAITRFIAGETAPVGADTATFMAEETKGAIETVAGAAADGVVKFKKVAVKQSRGRIDFAGGGIIAA